MQPLAVGFPREGLCKQGWAEQGTGMEDWGIESEPLCV